MFDFEIGNSFHFIHMNGELKPLDEWYDEVFSVKRTMHGGYSEVEKRDASLCFVADLCVETMAPSKVEGAEGMPVGRFYSRFGSHWHSMAWYVDEGFKGLFDNLHANGVRLFTDGGGSITEVPRGSIFTHPRDTGCQWEFVRAVGGGGAARDWTPEDWRDKHPLGILPRAWHITAAVQDLENRKLTYANLLGGRLVHEEVNDANGTKSAFVRVGTDTLVELASPVSPNSLVAKDLEKNGDIMHAITFRVKDIAAAESFIRSKNIRIENRTKDTFLMNPDDTFGGVLYISQRVVPGDDRV